MDKQKKYMNYLSNVNPIFERLIIDLLIDQPSDFVQFFLSMTDLIFRWLASDKRTRDRAKG